MTGWWDALAVPQPSGVSVRLVWCHPCPKPLLDPSTKVGHGANP